MLRFLKILNRNLIFKNINKKYNNIEQFRSLDVIWHYQSIKLRKYYKIFRKEINYLFIKMIFIILILKNHIQNIFIKNSILKHHI